MFRNRSVNVHAFSMIPSASIPRSSFRIQHTHKTTLDSGYLVPIYVDEILPGDSFRTNCTIFARLATPLFPLMDNLHLDTFFFFVPNRLVWTNWKRMMGERDNPNDSVSFVVPQQVTPTGGYAVNSLQDYFGLPTVGQLAAGSTVSHNALPLRAYNLIYNEWFRDENLQDSLVVDKGDGPDPVSNYVLRRRGKRHDYFTACLPWPQKGQPVSVPIGTSAPVFGAGSSTVLQTVIGQNNAQSSFFQVSSGATQVNLGAAATATQAYGVSLSGVYADLSGATAATINQLRQAFQIQRLLERDARGGTRYTEQLRSHFGVVSPDARLQRPEYLGGGSVPVSLNPIAQSSATGVTGATSPLGTLSAMGTVVSTRNGFAQSFTEHGYIIGLAQIRADLTYQQGMRKMWSRSTRYDFYWPVFAMLGEQTVLNREIYCRGDAGDAGVFGYQERWAEYRHHPSRVSGLFRSTAAGTLDAWHLAQNFTALPTLNSQFISDTPPVDRITAVPSQTGKQFICDMFFDTVAARPMPMYSVPGLIDHF